MPLSSRKSGAFQYNLGKALFVILTGSVWFTPSFSLYLLQAYYKKKYDLKRKTKIFDLSVVTAIQQIEEISKFEMDTPPYDKIKEICDNVRME